MCAHPWSGVLGFPRGMPCSQEKTWSVIRSPVLLPQAQPPQIIPCPRTIAALLSASTPGTLPQSHTPSHAKVPFSLGAAEVTYGPHRTFGLPVPHDPSDSLSLHSATGIGVQRG